MAQRTITLTDRRPVIIEETEWPVLSHAETTLDGLKAAILVRQHADGRCIVYGTLGAAPKERRGYYVYGHEQEFPDEQPRPCAPTDAALIMAIRQTADELDVGELASAVIAGLPAERL